jgi:hypothetical protein
MPSLDFDAIKREIHLTDVLSVIGWGGRLEPCGSLRGPCPIHESRSPRSRSFVVTGEEWYCHRCKKGGGKLDLYALITGKPIFEATIELCNRLGTPAYHLRRQVPPPR